MTKKILAILLAFLFVCLLPAYSLGLVTSEVNKAPTIRVLLGSSSSAGSFSFTVSSGTYYIVSESALNGSNYYKSSMNASAKVSSGSSYTMKAGSGLIAVPENKDCTFKYGYYTYRGAFKAVSSGSYYYAVNQLDVELYLYGVVGNEIGSFNTPSMEAQAVAARSYAIGNISSSNNYYDVTSTTSSQVYYGYSSESAKIRNAVDSTCGWVLAYNGDIIETYYSSSHGGYSENIENVWMSDAVPLVGVPCPYDKVAGTTIYGDYAASCWSWTVEYTPEDLEYLAKSYSGTDIGDFVNITMSKTYNGKTSVSGRAMQVTINGTKGSVTATKDKIRWLLDLKSTLFTISNPNGSQAVSYVLGKGNKLTPWEDISGLFAQSGSGSIIEANGSDDEIYVLSADGKSKLSKAGVSSGGNIVISGYGYGHGVGMSQWGAIAMGDNGYTWQEIIDLFYCQGGVKLTRCY